MTDRRSEPRLPLSESPGLAGVGHCLRASFHEEVAAQDFAELLARLDRAPQAQRSR